MLNNPRMAQLHAQEAPGPRPRARALGRRLRPDARRPDPPAPVRRPLPSAPRPRRRPDRPRDDPDAPGPRRRGRDHGLHGVHDHPPHDRPDRVRGAFGYWRTTGGPVVFPAKAIVLATGGDRQGLRDHLELVGVLRRRPGAGLSRRRRADRHGVRPVPPDRHGLATRRPRPPRDRGGPRRGRDPAQQGRRAVHVEVPARGPPPRVRRDRRGGAALGRGAERGPADRRPPPARALDPRQRRARDLHARSARAAARPTAASSSTSATCRPTTSGASCPRCTSSSRSWPTSTSRPARWRSGRRPTTSWAASGSTPRRARRRGPGCTRRARSPAGCTARTGSAATRSRTCSCSASGPGAAAAAAAAPSRSRLRRPGRLPGGRAELGRAARARGTGEDPYRLHEELQATMQSLVGIFRTEDDLHEAIGRIAELRARWPTIRVSGGRAYNPGWASSSSFATC